MTAFKEKLNKLVKEVLSKPLKESKSCSCGCNSCGEGIGPRLNEHFKGKLITTEALDIHIKKSIPLTESKYPKDSKEYKDLIDEARYLYSRKVIDLNKKDEKLILKENQFKKGDTVKFPRTTKDNIVQGEFVRYEEGDTTKPYGVAVVKYQGKEIRVKDSVLIKEYNNDNLSMALRAMKDQNKSPKPKPLSKSNPKSNNTIKLKALEKMRARVMSDMEQEAEPEGGPIADRYGRELEKIDKAISKLKGQKGEMTYGQAMASDPTSRFYKSDQKVDESMSKIIHIGTNTKNDTDYYFDPNSGIFYVNVIDGGGNRYNKLKVNTINDVLGMVDTWKWTNDGKDLFPEEINESSLEEAKWEVSAQLSSLSGGGAYEHHTDIEATSAEDALNQVEKLYPRNGSTRFIKSNSKAYRQKKSNVK